LGASLTAYRVRGGDDGVMASAVPDVIESNPDRLNQNTAY
jgi:hypothetical protein